MAPFKLRFSKMSMSRSRGSKGSRSNSLECEEPAQQQQPNNSNSQALVGCNSRPEASGTDCNGVVAIVCDYGGFPDSPPPSYQYVLEETRQKRSTTNTEEEQEEDEGEENAAEEKRGQQQEKKSQQQEKVDQSKSTETQKTSAGGGGGGGGGDGGGGGTGGSGRTPAKGPEILHKSSKELYRAVAKQWGITCKMSDQCRCFDCQSHYFDCDYERDEQGKTDGGLGAGSPIYIAEVLHGTACILL